MTFCNTCMICLNVKDDLTNITNTTNPPDICLKTKLGKCVPEIDWKDDYGICTQCSDQVENSYNFREVCLNTQEARCKLWEDSIRLKCIKQENSNLDDNAINSNEFDEPLTIAEEVKSETSHCSDDKEEFFCKTCGKRYVNKKFHAKHEKTCGTVAIKTEQDESNVEVERDSGRISQYKCDACDISFSTKYVLKRHKKNVHATEKNFKCDQCPSTFVSSVNLTAHKKYHSGNRHHICLFCGKGFITASDLYHHEKIHENKRAYKCTHCDRAYNTSSDLHKHNICVHVDRSLWKYSCQFCDRKFPQKTNLNSHVKTHTGEKKFSCHLCDNKYILRSALTRHIESHTNVEPFKCNDCGLSYRSKKSLEMHMVTNHRSGDEVAQKLKKFSCHLCPKSSYSKSKLERHIRSHTGEKPFKCPECDRRFVDKSYIKQHLRTSHKKDVKSSFKTET